MASKDEAAVQAAIQRARNVQLEERQQAMIWLGENRLRAAITSMNEVQLRQALRAASALECEHLPLYAEAKALEQNLHGKALVGRLEAELQTGIDKGDISVIVIVRSVAAQHGLDGFETRALEAALALAEKALHDDDLETLLSCEEAARDSGARWDALETYVKSAQEELTMERGLRAAAADGSVGCLGALRAIEARATSSGRPGIAERAARLVSEVATRHAADLGLPASWDVVHELAGTDASRLLKKTEAKEAALLNKLQELVDFTFTGWGGLGRNTRTRDRPHEPIAKRIEVKSVVHVQNAETFFNYRVRRQEVADQVPSSALRGDALDVKTARVPIDGVGHHGTGPVDHGINEFYLWHGTSPEGAAGITDTSFDLSRAGSTAGAMFGYGIYLAESCLKSDEYTKPDSRGWFPLVLCRATLGVVKYCDAKDPFAVSSELEAACRPGGGSHSVLGDREKVRSTFREFIVYDSHQVYPEFIIWYERQF
eukprot:TRINITY_DN27828_c0_g1_i1.p1 TRINITY_DN27828_c0_g1~~TRINITY_DN27828_c0_g1_i1.p1  ORF type:complete len:532 (+),score=136.71 TRINITY_DN27828_c0_g1_i1:136-1596(+)